MLSIHSHPYNLSFQEHVNTLDANVRDCVNALIAKCAPVPASNANAFSPDLVNDDEMLDAPASLGPASAVPLPPDHEKKLKASSMEQCAVCMDAPADCIVMPCQHTSCCLNCVKKLSTMRNGKLCVLCRCPVSSVHWDGGSENL